MAPPLHKSTPPFSQKGIVYLIDDDESILSILGLLLRHHDYSYKAFTSAQSFFDCFELMNDRIGVPACVLSDVNMPNVDGLELQRRLALADDLPLILMSGLCSPKDVVEAFRQNTFDFLVKPFDNDELLKVIDRALKSNVAQRARKSTIQTGRLRLATLSPREHEITDLIKQGLTSQQIASSFDIALRTVKLHRQKIMQKLDVESHSELMQLLHLLEASDAK